MLLLLLLSNGNIASDSTAAMIALLLLLLWLQTCTVAAGAETLSRRVLQYTCRLHIGHDSQLR